MPLASLVCYDCRAEPSHKLWPCEHTTCQKHFGERKGSDARCGICEAHVNSVEKIDNSPTPLTGSFAYDQHSSRRVRSNSPFDVFDNMPPKDDLSDFSFDRNDSMTPSPALDKDGLPDSRGLPYRVSTEEDQFRSSTTRYVPPQMRNGPLQSDRPDSAASFMTQPPATPKASTQSGAQRAHSNTHSWGRRTDEIAMPVSQYRMLAGQLTQDSGVSDPFVDRTSRFGSQSYVHRHGDSVSTHRSGFGELTNERFSRRSTISNPAMAAALRTDLPPQERAAHLAALIRSGATEDPHDIDYGNQGRSRRLPAESTAIPTMPLPKGKIAPGYSNALVTYNDAEANNKGNTAAYLGVNTIALPGWFHQVKDGYKPTLEEVFDCLPMIEACRIAKPTTAGVIKIANLPYQSSRSEVVAFLGRNAQINSQPEGSPFHASHIMMDRHTAKTNDAWVEVKSGREAVFVFNQFDKRTKAGRSAKIGDREVEISISSQADFLAELFPRAKHVQWYGAVPQVDDGREEYLPGVESTGFIGFLQDEELTFMGKFAETPARYPFAGRVPIRNYEAMITLLHKYPWFAVDHVLLHERQAIFDTALKCIRSLITLLHENRNGPGMTRGNGSAAVATANRMMPTSATLHELAVAVLTCPGFSENQKAAVINNLIQGGHAQFTVARGMIFTLGGTGRFASDWPFHALVKQPGAPDELVDYIAGLLREATTGSENLTLAQLHSMRTAGTSKPKFGQLSVDYAGVKTLGELGAAELRTIEMTLGRVLPRAR